MPGRSLSGWAREVKALLFVLCVVLDERLEAFGDEHGVLVRHGITKAFREPMAHLVCVGGSYGPLELPRELCAHLEVVQRRGDVMRWRYAPICRSGSFWHGSFPSLVGWGLGYGLNHFGELPGAEAYRLVAESELEVRGRGYA